MNSRRKRLSGFYAVVWIDVESAEHAEAFGEDDLQAARLRYAALLLDPRARSGELCIPGLETGGVPRLRHFGATNGATDVKPSHA